MKTEGKWWGHGLAAKKGRDEELRDAVSACSLLTTRGQCWHQAAWLDWQTTKGRQGSGERKEIFINWSPCHLTYFPYRLSSAPSTTTPFCANCGKRYGGGNKGREERGPKTDADQKATVTQRPEYFLAPILGQEEKWVSLAEAFNTRQAQLQTQHPFLDLLETVSSAGSN